MWLECRHRLCDFLWWLQWTGVQLNASIGRQMIYMVYIVKYWYWEKNIYKNFVTYSHKIAFFSKLKLKFVYFEGNARFYFENLGKSL